MLNLIQPGRLEEHRGELPMRSTQSGSFDSPRSGTFVSAGAAVQVPPFPLVSEALTAGCIPGGPRAATENVRNAISLLLRAGGYCREPRDTRGSYFNREHGIGDSCTNTASQLHGGNCLLCANRIRQRMENTPAHSSKGDLWLF